nr:PREDICTED: protein 5NUC-like [Bemisia tabaci]XP_018897164.1 PREDICTED: protein 5NUC-like [Bemisia tabaci]XP_018897165.1 PREDICTED: protein 5NUC-like [Bemisia tabaci]
MQQLLALLALAACLADVRGAFKLTLLHTNDMHARFDETNQNTGPCKNTVSHKGCYGGFARLKHAVLEARQRAAQQGRSSLFLNAGDNFQGTPYYTLFKWDVTADLLNRLDIDVMSLGNHEFDDGVAGLAPFLQKSKTPIVSANVDTGAETSLQSSNGVLIQKSLKIKLGSTTVCVVGYLTPETKFLANTGKVAISEEVEAIRAEIKRLKQEPGADKCHVIIGLGHSGFDVDKHIAAVVPEIDVIVGGHTDTFLYSGKQPDIEKPEANYPYMVTQESGKRVPVVQAYGYTKYLGELELDWDDNWNLVRASGNPVLLDDKVPQDAPVAEEVKKWTAKLSENANQVVGSTTARLEGTTGLCSCAECNLGNLIADAYVEYYATKYRHLIPPEHWTDAPISFCQAGSVRATIDGFYSSGNITYGDVLTVMPFKNKLIKTTITGAQLLKTLEFSVAPLDASCSNKHSKSAFLQVSGIHVTFDMSKPPNSRVVEARVRCGHCMVPKYLPLDKNATYGVIMTDYIFMGGDNYSFDQDAPITTLELTDTETVVDYIRRKSPVYPELSGRVKVLNLSDPVSGSSVLTVSLLLFLSTLFLTSYSK